jgi:hypothetical protein
MRATIMARDVDYICHKGTYRLKALTPRAKEYFAKKLVMHGELIKDEKAEIFLTGISPEHFKDWLEELWSNDLVTEKDAPKPVEYAPGAAPWEL